MSNLRLKADHAEIAITEEKIVEHVAQAIDLVRQLSLPLGHGLEVDLRQVLVVGKGM